MRWRGLNSADVVIVMLFCTQASRGTSFHVTVKDVCKASALSGMLPVRSVCLWHASIVCIGSTIKDP